MTGVPVIEVIEVTRVTGVTGARVTQVTVVTYVIGGGPVKAVIGVAGGDQADEVAGLPAE
ncbi:hypothetical protein [Nonomuraea maritima]|uniref:hypothetical protein n=1 Tax=Nonomuraea maritima TaxID=683260 RepID=UPI00115FD55C|nr:hypothetical protein [Nonomuraea maritima]